MRRDKPDSNLRKICDAILWCGFAYWRIADATGRAGVPDLLVVGHGHVVLAEVKRPLGPRGGRSNVDLTRAQREFAGECKRRGVDVRVWRSPDQAIADLMPLRRRRPDAAA